MALALLDSRLPGPTTGRRLLQAGAILAQAPIAVGYLGLRWEGIEHLPRHGPAIVAANHASVLDGFLLTAPAFLVRGGRLIRYLTADDQMASGFGPYLRFFSAFPIRIGRPDLGAYREALATLARGHLLGIFPEGGITRDGQLRPFFGGAAFLALRARVPIVPATINGSFAAWPRPARYPRPGRTRVVFHPPIGPTTVTWETIDGAMAETMARLEAAIRGRYRPPGDPGGRERP